MEIVNVNYLGSNPEYQEYSNKDTSLITGNIISRTFGETEDYIEYFIYDLNNNLLTSNYNVNSYVIKNSDAVNPTGNILLLNPDKDIQNEGFDRGAVNITYNFFRKLFNSNELSRFWINQISTDRTEIRVSRQDLSNDDLIQLFNEYDLNVSNKTYYPDFYLNFGDNKIIIGVNVAYTLVNEESALLIKLYEPLPSELGTKDTFWIVDKLSEPATYNIDIQIPAEATVTTESLRGPNYNVEVLNRIGQITDYQSLGSFYTGSSLTSYQQLKSLTEEKGIDINVDYTSFNNFIHFSSAYERIYNFAYKIQLIESYNSDLNSLNNIFLNTNTVSGSRTVLQNKINDIIEKFDGYEYYLYYSSGSTSWPKSNNTKPYQLYAYTSSQVQNWLGSENTVPTAVTQSILYSASLYDNNNKDWLLNTVPEYLKNDPNNQPYQIFLNMIGQHFDNIWIYIKDITNRYNAENSLDKGISKDEIGNALKSLGIKLYTNTSTSNNIYDSVLGIGPNGQIQPNTGSELINNYVTTSVNLPLDDIAKENYKRIYHNLPYLLKTKGTRTGLQALINCFGIPDTILRINEFGGSDKMETTSDQIQDDYMVSYYNTGSDNIFLPWGPVRYNYLKDGSSTKVPDAIEFSFRNIQGIPTTSSLYTQSLFIKSGANITTTNFDFGINLRYNPVTAITGTLSQYDGELRFYLRSGSATTDAGYAKTSPITLPFFDPTQWWTVAAVRDSGSLQTTYTLYVANALYNQEGGTNIGFQASSSIIVSGSVSSSFNTNWNDFPTSARICAALGGKNNNAILSPNNTRYQGLLKEFRYWSEPLSASAIFEHAKNLNSYTGNEPTSSLFNLIFRLPLGDARDFPSGSQTIFSPYDNSLLRRYSMYESILSSSHPAVSGTFFVNNTYPAFSNIGSIISQSAASNVNVSFGFFPTSGSKSFISEQRYNLLSTPATGLNQKVNNKINVLEQEYLDENVLSRDISVQLFDYNISRNSQDIEVGFSPSDLIDYDITNQIGYFNIDDYIGSTSDLYTDNYTDLDNLRKTYFQKYISSFKLWDFVRLIKYYDNSLFKMIKDFVPARTNLSTGIIVKPHILERSKYKRNEPIASYTQYSQSIDMIYISGSNPQGVLLNTDYTQYLSSSVGILTKSFTDESQAFTGEFGGTEFEPINPQFNQYEVSNMSSNTSSYYITYSLNPLLNNVSSSVKSNFLLDIDYSSNPNIPVNNGLITQSFNQYIDRSNNINYTGLNSPAVPFAEVQDYNYNLFSYISSRYSGSKVSSLLYNEYTPPIGNYTGDQSYGQNPAIDHYTGKLGLFSGLTTSSFFSDRTQINLLYLVDIDGNYITLNKNNKNLFEVQNVFKQDTLTIDLFDPKQYGNQIKSNGVKSIYSVGYEYSPILYTSGTAGTMSFDILNSDDRADTYYYTPPAGLISTTPYNTSSVSVNGQTWRSFYNLYRTGSDPGNFTTDEFRVGTITAGLVTNSYFQPSASGYYSFYNNINFSVESAPSETITARLRIYKTGSSGGEQVQSDINNTFSGGTSYYQSSFFYFYSAPYTITDVAFDILGGEKTEDLRIGFSPPTTITGGFIIDQVEIYFVKTGITETAYNVRGTGYIISDIPDIVNLGAEGVIALNSTIDGLYLDSTNNERLEFQLLLSSSLGSFSSTPYMSSATLYNSVVGSGGDVPILNGSQFYLGIDVSGENNKLILTGSIASFYSNDIGNPDAIFLPSNSNLYDRYGDITDPFVLEPGDKILFNTKTREAFSEYDIITPPAKIGTSRVEITVQPNLPSNLLSGSADGNLKTIIFLKKKEDETSIYVNFTKPVGKTSFGFSIPEDLNPNVLENIDTINKEIQAKKLINDVSDPLNQLNGGDF